MDLSFYMSLFLRRLHWFILTVVICSTLGVILARYLPTVYETEARLVVESEQIPGELAASTVQTQALEQLQIIQQRILTRDILIDMVNRLDIYADRRTRGERPLDGDEIVEDMRDRIKIAITGASSGRRGETQATLVTISFSAPTGPLAAAVTNEVVTLILREDVGMRTRVARQTLEYFEQEVGRLDQELSEKSNAILVFKEANITALPDSLEFRRSQQAAAQERLLQLERQAAELADRRDRMEQFFAVSSSREQPTPPEQMTLEEERLESFYARRLELLSVLSPDNPKVLLLEQQIASLEGIVEDQIKPAGVSGQPDQALTVYELQMAELDGQIDYVLEQQQAVRTQIDELTVSIEATPSNAIELDTLERDYQAVQEQYAQAVANRAKAETGDTIEALSKGRRISVIEQAIAPRSPTSPNRPVVAAAGVGGGAVLGLLLVALIEFLKPGIRRPADISNKLGIKPFGTLPYMRTRREIIRRRVLVWGGLLCILASFAAALWGINEYYMPLDLLLEQIQRRLN